MQKIYANYDKLSNGNYCNKLTRQEIKAPIDIGHMYGWEHRRLSLAAKELNWSQKQFMADSIKNLGKQEWELMMLI